MMRAAVTRPPLSLGAALTSERAPAVWCSHDACCYVAGAAGGCADAWAGV